MNRLGGAIAYQEGLGLDRAMAGTSAAVDLPKDHRWDSVEGRILRVRSGSAPGTADVIDGRADLGRDMRGDPQTNDLQHTRSNP